MRLILKLLALHSAAWRCPCVVCDTCRAHVAETMNNELNRLVPKEVS